ncbi:MAG: hypothetical protein ACI9UR_002191 [Bacteroidia bacterium]|jgi:hypothetical protein
MFKRLFFLSGIIAFILACSMMYFWYLPNLSTEDSVATEQEQEHEIGVYSIDSDSLNTTMPLE